MVETFPWAAGARCRPVYDDDEDARHRRDAAAVAELTAAGCDRSVCLPDG